VCVAFMSVLYQVGRGLSSLYCPNIFRGHFKVGDVIIEEISLGVVHRQLGENLSLVVRDIKATISHGEDVLWGDTITLTQGTNHGVDD